MIFIVDCTILNHHEPTHRIGRICFNIFVSSIGTYANPSKGFVFVLRIPKLFKASPKKISCCLSDKLCCFFSNYLSWSPLYSGGKKRSSHDFFQTSKIHSKHKTQISESRFIGIITPINRAITRWWFPNMFYFHHWRNDPN